MRKVWRWLLVTLGLILICVLGFLWYIKSNWKPILEKQLKELVHSSTDGLYKLEYGKLDLKPLLGNVTLENVYLIPDSIVYKRLVKEGKAPNSVFDVSLSKFSLRGIGFREALQNKKLKIKRVEVEDPSVYIKHYHHAFNDTTETQPSRTLYEKVNNVFASIQIDYIKLDQLDLTYSKIDSVKKDAFLLSDVNLNLRDVLLDSMSDKDITRFFFSKEVDIHVPKFEYMFSDELYALHLERLNINSLREELSLNNFSIKPVLAKQDFFKKKNRNVTMVEISFDSIAFNSLDLRGLLMDESLVANSLLLNKGKVTLSKDKRYPQKEENNVGKSPHQLLMKLGNKIAIDTVYLEDVGVSYVQFSERYSKEGSISFDQTRGFLSNVTNDTSRLMQNRIVKAELKSQIMNRGSLNVEFGFDMLSTSGLYTYKGSLGTMKASAFNRILTPLLNVEISSGNIKRINFDMQGTDYRNNGQFRFDYDDMKILLLGEDGNEAPFSKKVVSFFVNTFLLNSSNPDTKGVYHIANVNHQRDPHHTFFKSLWQSLFQGIKITAGISPERESQWTERARTLQDKVGHSKESIERTKGGIRNFFIREKEDR